MGFLLLEFTSSHNVLMLLSEFYVITIIILNVFSSMRVMSVRVLHILDDCHKKEIKNDRTFLLPLLYP